MVSQLTIKLTGTIDTSNFEEWKQDLIDQIHSVNKKLVTDEDFVLAGRQVKSFKSAENDLKKAKQSAINQASEIQQLFSTIDEVTEEARQARLLLDRQIKVRKLEIKDELIQAGINDVQNFINEQIEEFNVIDTSGFIDRSRFESITKGKAGIKGIQTVINQLCQTIKEEVSDKASELTNNILKINALSKSQKLLFQDQKLLLALPPNELELEIDKRIARFNEENLKRETRKKIADLEQAENLELNPEINSVDIQQKEHYQLTIKMTSTKSEAIEIARLIKHEYGNTSAITEIKLSRPHD